MSKEKLNKVAKLYTAASAIGDAEKDLGKEDESDSPVDRSPASEKRSKKLDFNEGRGGLRTTIYKDKE